VETIFLPQTYRKHCHLLEGLAEEDYDTVTLTVSGLQPSKARQWAQEI